jgi:hypothetical protein
VLPDFLTPAARVGILLALLILVAGVERLVRGHAASRWKEYLFLVAAGTVGAGYGVLNDLVTHSISPEYFSLGKQVHSLGGVVELGAMAGFSAGAVGACLLLYANNPRPDRARLAQARLARFAAIPLLLAFLGSLAGFLVGTPESLVRNLYPELGDPAAGSFGTVWAIHIGLYVGLLVGVAIAITGVARARRTDPTTG